MFNEYLGKFIHLNSTVCIRSHNADLIEQTITNSLINEGFVKISQPPFPSHPGHIAWISTYLSYRMNPYIWVFGLYPSPIDREWTIIKASVPDTFYASRKGNSYPRLSDWAMEIGSDAFLYHVREEKYRILLEAAEYGEIAVSGFIDNFVDNKIMFYNELVIQDFQDKLFLLLNVPEEFQMLEKEIPVNEKQKLNMTYIEKVDRNLFRLLCDCEDFWFSHNLLYDSYAKSKEFNNFGVKLLFFQVGAFELDTDSGEIWKAFDFSDWRQSADYERVNLPLT
ncbi:hypothetical protein [Myxosarcina sp. GI1]|uniref:hypothetical protein n=1 Tax=Myxosarcina sp. GI1 TaxID=1541065 RepID=UPI0012E0583D|nr:hypothetical protein [Myxosarcina sp. GI1]